MRLLCTISWRALSFLSNKAAPSALAHVTFNQLGLNNVSRKRTTAHAHTPLTFMLYIPYRLCIDAQQYIADIRVMPRGVSFFWRNWFTPWHLALYLWPFFTLLGAFIRREAFSDFQGYVTCGGAYRFETSSQHTCLILQCHSSIQHRPLLSVALYVCVCLCACALARWTCCSWTRLSS